MGWESMMNTIRTEYIALQAWTEILLMLFLFLYRIWKYFANQVAVTWAKYFH